MATTRPGEIRCPSCHRSTPPAGFCTHCGAAIPSDLRVRPRGMDRDELQERIRARRHGADPYRRGFAPEGEEPGYARFEPAPEDSTARREPGGGPGQAPRVDHFDEASEPPPLTREPDEERAWPEADRWQPDERRSDEAVVPPPPPPYAAPPYEEPGYQAEPHYEEAGPYAGPYADDYAPDAERPDDDYAYEDWDSGRSSGGGRSGAVAIIGFLALGVAALLGGAFLANLFSDGTATAPTPTPVPSIEEPAETATPESTPAEPAAGTAEATGSPTPGDGPVTFPDGVIFQVQACASTGDMGFDGCVPEVTTISGGNIYAWMGFGLPTSESEPANGSDSLVIILRTADGAVVAQSVEPIVIGDRVSCANTCSGYIYQGYTGLTPGEYELILERNGEFADSATFTVES